MINLIANREVLGLVLLWFWGWGMTVLLRWLPGKIEGWLATKPNKKKQ